MIPLVIGLLVLVCMPDDAYAQKEYYKKNGKTYVYDNAKRRVYNESQMTKAPVRHETEGYEVLNQSMVAETFRQILSAKRLKELKNDIVAVTFVCDKDGKIDNVKFVYQKTFSYG